MKFLSQFFAIIVWATIGVNAVANPVQDAAVVKIIKSADEFASEHKISRESALGLFSDVFWAQELQQKAGIGLVRKGVFVNLNEKTNRLISGGSKVLWEGLSRDKAQVVIITDNGVVSGSDLTAKEREAMVICIFTPDKVQILDLGAKMGGFYERR